jgi:hypothetical protein
VTRGLSRYKMGNFDNMMIHHEVASKYETQIEALIRRIQKSYVEVDPKADATKLLVDSKEFGPIDSNKYLTKFIWDDSKFPKNQSIHDLLKIILQVCSQPYLEAYHRR